MDKKSKILLAALLALILASLALTYHRSFTSLDYDIIRGEGGEIGEGTNL